MHTAENTLLRCRWASNEWNIPYHDAEWGAPVHDEKKWFEFLILEGAQAGLSWDTVLRKRERYREVFDAFDPEKVARYDAKKVRQLLSDPGIIRNRLKIAATISNPGLAESAARIWQLRRVCLAFRERQTQAKCLETQSPSANQGI